MARTSRYSQEVRERAVRMVFEHGSEYDSEWEAICSIAEDLDNQIGNCADAKFNMKGRVQGREPINDPAHKILATYEHYILSLAIVL